MSGFLTPPLRQRVAIFDLDASGNVQYWQDGVLQGLVGTKNVDFMWTVPATMHEGSTSGNAGGGSGAGGLATDGGGSSGGGSGQGIANVPTSFVPGAQLSLRVGGGGSEVVAGFPGINGGETRINGAGLRIFPALRTLAPGMGGQVGSATLGAPGAAAAWGGIAGAAAPAAGNAGNNSSTYAVQRAGGWAFCQGSPSPSGGCPNKASGSIVVATNQTSSDSGWPYSNGSGTPAPDANNGGASLGAPSLFSDKTPVGQEGALGAGGGPGLKGAPGKKGGDGFIKFTWWSR